MLNAISPRLAFASLVLLSLASMLFALFYLEGQLNLPPCPLCMTQRVFIVGWGIVALLAVVHNPMGVGRRIYGGLCALCGILGGAVAARHVWLQYLPADEVPACGPSLQYMLETLPFSETLELVLMGDGNCADVQWTFLGLSIPEQALGLFLVATLISLWQTFRSYPART